MPADMTVEGNTTGGATVTWTDPTATDIVDANPAVACSPASGSLFTLGGPHTVTCTATDDSSNSDSASFKVTVVDTTKPSITCPADVSGTVGQAVNLGTPTVSDIVDSSPTVTNNAPGTFSPGLTVVKWTATDDSLNSDYCTQNVKLLYDWNGFFQPVDNPGSGTSPVMNRVKAGSAIPVKFSLGGNQGMSIFFTGYPSSVQVTCNAYSAIDDIESTVTAGGSTLNYDSTSGQYNYVWKTDKAWGGTCRKLIVKLADGVLHEAYFTFTK